MSGDCVSVSHVSKMCNEYYIICLYCTIHVHNRLEVNVFSNMEKNGLHLFSVNMTHFKHPGFCAIAIAEIPFRVYEAGMR